MALFSECMLGCARKALDTADIVRDGDFAPIDVALFVKKGLGPTNKNHSLRPTAAETRPPLILLQMNHPDVRNARKLTKVYWWTRLYQLSIFQSEEIHRGEADGNGVIRVIPPHIAKLRVCI